MEEKTYLFNNNFDNIATENLKNIKAISFDFLKKYHLVIIFSLLTINAILIYQVFMFKNKINDDPPIYNNLGDYGLYEFFKKPQISIIIPNINKWNFQNNYQMRNYLNQIRKQTLQNFEVLIISPQTDNKAKDYIKSYVSNDKRFKVYKQVKGSLLDNIYFLVGKVSAKFLMVWTKQEFFQNNEFEKFYNITKGKVNNVFKLKKADGSTANLIRTKPLRDAIDEDIKISDFSQIVNYISKKRPALNYISVSLCPDDYYTAYTHVAMISILDSKFSSTYIAFYMVVNTNFTRKSMDFISSLYDDYDYFNITFLIMDDRYENAYISRYLTTQTYFRFSLGEFIPYLNRIIYLDTDVTVHKDLNEFYHTNFNGKMVLGQITFNNQSPKTGTYKINNGILLFNLKRMRKIQLERKVLFIINNGFKNEFHDQYLLNEYFIEEIGIFPPEFHTRPWNNVTEMTKFLNQSGRIYNIDYFYYICKYPTIIHYAYRAKPLYDNTSKAEDWWYFARKSKYFREKSLSNLSDIFNYTYNK